MSDLEDLQRKHDKLAEENQASYQQLQQQAGVTMNTESMRLNLFIDFATEIGLLTEEERLNFEILFHERVKESLDGVWEQYRAAAKKQQLATPKKPGLIIPGDFRRGK